MNLYKLLEERPLLRQTCPEIVGAAADMEQMKVEIARLKALKTPASRQLLEITKAALDNAEAEIASGVDELHACALREQKLRAALEEIENYPPGKNANVTFSMRMIARQALANKEGERP